MRSFLPNCTTLPFLHVLCRAALDRHWSCSEVKEGASFNVFDKASVTDSLPGRGSHAQSC